MKPRPTLTKLHLQVNSGACGWRRCNALQLPGCAPSIRHALTRCVLGPATPHQLPSKLNFPAHKLPIMRPVPAGPSARPRLRSCSSSQDTRGSAVLCTPTTQQAQPHVARHGIAPGHAFAAVVSWVDKHQMYCSRSANRNMYLGLVAVSIDLVALFCVTCRL